MTEPNWFDRFAQQYSTRLARATSRRSVLARLSAMVGSAVTLPLLPVLRASAAETVAVNDDPQSCDYWRYCAIDGFLCSCCGGSYSSCPPGTERSPVTWVGTCKNPQDGKDYIISYNDCCGKSTCGRCLCNRNEGDKPVYSPAKSNDILWCFGTQSHAYHCSTAMVIGVSQPAA